MKLLPHFSDRLKELMLENNLTTTELGKAIAINGSTVCYWLEGKRNISLSNAIKLADYFKCSLDFLFGRSEKKLDYIPQSNYPSFYDRLRQVMEQCGITRYRIVKENIVADSNFTGWTRGGNPFMQTVIDLADYFGYTIDEFIGRDKNN